MARHQWAADRLWEGMVGAADESWQAGLDVLARAPLPSPSPSADQVVLATRLQRLAEHARATLPTEGLDQRAATYGEILVVCAGCHATRR
jgi:hypothetical protein